MVNLAPRAVERPPALLAASKRLRAGGQGGDHHEALGARCRVTGTRCGVHVVRSMLPGDIWQRTLKCQATCGSFLLRRENVKKVILIDNFFIFQ